MTNGYDIAQVFPSVRIVVVGDAIGDEAIYATAAGISAETPTIVARYERRESTLGGAALVVRNLEALGVQHKFLTTPRDCCMIKRRYWVDGYKLLQIDEDWTGALDDAERERCVDARLTDSITEADVVIVADYRHGLLTRPLAERIVGECHVQNKTLFVASQMSQNAGNHEWYTGADVFVLNEREARDVIDRLGRVQVLRARSAVVVTRGALGADVCTDAGTQHVAAIELGDGAVDTCGAGDAFIAMLAATWNSLGVDKAVRMANVWAGLACLTRGPNPPTLGDFLERMV